MSVKFQYFILREKDISIYKLIDLSSGIHREVYARNF